MNTDLQNHKMLLKVDLLLFSLSFTVTHKTTDHQDKDVNVLHTITVRKLKK